MISHTTAYYSRAGLLWIKGQAKQAKSLSTIHVRTPYYFFLSAGYRSQPTTPRTNQLVSTPVSIGCCAPIRTKSSDADYLAFLDKANAQREAGASQTLSQSSEPYTQTVDTGVRVPEALTSVDEYYVSETDEPFEPVALKWPEAAYGKWPGGGKFLILLLTNKEQGKSGEHDGGLLIFYF
jgi:hypothetical protein